jgi:hypothetical protein
VEDAAKQERRTRRTSRPRRKDDQRRKGGKRKKEDQRVNAATKSFNIHLNIRLRVMVEDQVRLP